MVSRRDDTVCNFLEGPTCVMNVAAWHVYIHKLGQRKLHNSLGEGNSGRKDSYCLNQLYDESRKVLASESGSGKNI